MECHLSCDPSEGGDDDDDVGVLVNNKYNEKRGRMARGPAT